MKKILVTLLVAALCAPAMAATIDVVGGADGTATVTISAEGEELNLVGLGLDVDVDGGAQVTDVVIGDAAFNIYPDAAYSQVLDEDPNVTYVYGTGSPVADKTAPGQIDLPQSSFALSFGNLNGESAAGADGAASVTITITVDAACTLTVCENATRGGIVAVDGESLDAACDSDAITFGNCYTEGGLSAGDAAYDLWVSVGEPECWCFVSQCHGDADGIINPGNAKAGIPAHHVDGLDLGILSEGWQLPSTDPGFADFVCADFDHIENPGNAKAGIPAHRVDGLDLGILAGSWQVATTPAIEDCTPGTRP